MPAHGRTMGLTYGRVARDWRVTKAFGGVVVTRHMAKLIGISKQGLESGSGEVTVVRKSLPQPEPLHDRERQVIHQTWSAG